jgi:hypothetical protein
VAVFSTARFPLLYRRIPIATKRNTYAKRQREQDKKQRADQKRAKREHKKDTVQPAALPEGTLEETLPEEPAR